MISAGPAHSHSAVVIASPWGPPGVPCSSGPVQGSGGHREEGRGGGTGGEVGAPCTPPQRERFWGGLNAALSFRGASVTCTLAPSSLPDGFPTAKPGAPLWYFLGMSVCGESFNSLTNYTWMQLQGC